MKQAITREEFNNLTKNLVGLTVSRPWRGYGSAIFLELGRLHREPYPDNKGGSLRGEATVMIEWSWRVEGVRTIRFGSWSGERKMSNGIETLKGRKVEDVSVGCRLPEIVIRLSANLWVHSFTTVEGQPKWTLFLPDRSWLCVERGNLVREKR
jgi:hypothetical protein